MSADSGGPAFPFGVRVIGERIEEDNEAGMSLRDYFAAKALQGFMANKSNPGRFHPDEDAAWAYKIADAMLKARQA